MVAAILQFLVAMALAAPEAPAPVSPGDDKGAVGRAVEIQAKLAEKIDFDLVNAAPLDEVLDKLLDKRGLPFTVDEPAFAVMGLDQDSLTAKQIDPFKVTKIARATILKRLLAKVPATSDNGAAVFVIRRDRIEITTREVYKREFFPESGEAVGIVPPLAYASFDETPLADALKELARTSEANILVDARVAADAKTKVSADFVAVPVDTAVSLLADSAGLMAVRVDNVYYVTSKENGLRLEKKQEDRQKERQQQGFPPSRMGVALRDGDRPSIAGKPARMEPAAAFATGGVPLLTGVVRAEAPAPAEDDGINRVLKLRKKLNERVHYGLKLPTTLDRVLHEFLTTNDMPFVVNEAAFVKAECDKDVLMSNAAEPFDAQGVNRATILKRLLARIKAVSAKGYGTYVIRPEGIEITTWEAYGAEFFPGEDVEKWAVQPPLITVSLDETPLADALKELARANDFNIVVDGRPMEAKTKVSAELLNVSPEVAVRVLADTAGLKLVRLENVYYVTSKENARALQDEEDKRRLERPKDKKQENEKIQVPDQPTAIYPGSKPAPSP